MRSRTEQTGTTASALPAAKVGHEKRDVSVRTVALAVGALLLVGVLLHFALAALEFGFRKETQREDRKLSGFVAEPALTAQRSRFPEPKLQTVPRDDLQSFRVREESELNTYAWINKTAGVVRIPIARAIDLLAERGLPVRGSNAAPGQISELDLIRNRMNQK